jgi:hypothetical protein
LIVLLLGVFFMFSTVGFAGDIMDMGRWPTLRFVLTVFIDGFFPVAYALSGFIFRNRFWKAFVPIFVVHFLLLDQISRRFPALPLPALTTTADIARLHARLNSDGTAIVLATALGYACFIHVLITEGRRYFRVHAEMALAAEIHSVLVPAIDANLGDFEFYGRSLPSGEVGGDLIDVFHNEGGWIAYIADVSGHGVAPGVVMGMVKSAARMQLSSRESSSQLLGRLNAVLQPIKKPEMFATFAYLAWNGERLEYSSAGHPAILHYRAATGEIAELACANPPLGLLQGAEFISESVDYVPDDLFVMVTDGLLETTNSKDEEFGLEGVKNVLFAQEGQPAGVVFDALLAAAHRHGYTTDDLSLLLVRCK